jgi:transposase InsO family protein
VQKETVKNESFLEQLLNSNLPADLKVKIYADYSQKYRHQNVPEHSEPPAPLLVPSVSDDTTRSIQNQDTISSVNIMETPNKEVPGSSHAHDDTGSSIGNDDASRNLRSGNLLKHVSLKKHKSLTSNKIVEKVDVPLKQNVQKLLVNVKQPFWSAQGKLLHDVGTSKRLRIPNTDIVALFSHLAHGKDNRPVNPPKGWDLFKEYITNPAFFTSTSAIRSKLPKERHQTGTGLRRWIKFFDGLNSCPGFVVSSYIYWTRLTASVHAATVIWLSCETTMKRAEENYLKNLYYGVENAESHTSFNALRRKLRQQNRQISDAELKEWLSQQPSYTSHHPVRSNFRRNRVIVHAVDELWEADLIDLQNISKSNLHTRFLLSVIDVLSKHAYIRPLKSKEGKNVANALTDILKEGRTPEQLSTDSGTEFFNHHVSKVLKTYDIHHFKSRSDNKCAVVERFNRSYKTRLFKYLDANNTSKYVHVLQLLTSAYNRSYHRSIKMQQSFISQKYKDATLGGQFDKFQCIGALPNYNVLMFSKTCIAFMYYIPAVLLIIYLPYYFTIYLSGSIAGFSYYLFCQIYVDSARRKCMTQAHRQTVLTLLAIMWKY